MNIVQVFNDIPLRYESSYVFLWRTRVNYSTSHKNIIIKWFIYLPVCAARYLYFFMLANYA